MSTNDALPRGQRLALYTLVCSVYLLTASGRLGSSDALAMFNVTRSLVTHQNFRSDPCEPAPKSADCVPGRDGGHYAGFGLAPSVAAVPGYAIGAVTAHLLRRDTRVLTDVTVSLYRTMIAAAIPLVLCLWLCRIGISPRAAVLGALLYAFASPAWINSKTYYSETYYSLALIGCCYFLARSDRIGSFLGAGACFGFACACRIYGLVLIPPFLVYALLLWRSRGLRLTRMVRNLVLIGLPFALFISLIALSNEIRFGSVFRTGYHLAFPSTGALLEHPLLNGMWQLLFAPEFGLVLYAPWVLAIPLLWRGFWNEFRCEAILVLSVFAVEYLFFSKYTFLHGGSSTGPRMLDALLLFLIVPLAAAFHDSLARGATVPRVRTAVVLAGLALLIQLVLAPSPEPRYYLMQDFDQAHSLHPWWEGQPILASIAGLPALFSAPPSNGACPACDYLRTYPNSVNLVRADFWLYKASLLGVPRPIAAFASIALIFLACYGAKRLLSLRAASQRSAYGEF